MQHVLLYSLTVFLSFLCNHLVVAQDWWPRIKEEFGNGAVSPPLQKCRRKKGASPAEGERCARRPKTCFFGTQTCEQVGDHPTHRCTCDNGGVTGKFGQWSCVEETCPNTEQEVIDVVNTAPASDFIYRSSPSSPLEVTMKLLTQAVLTGYNTSDELCDDLNQTVRFYVNNLIEQQAQLPPFVQEELVDVPFLQFGPLQDVSQQEQVSAPSPSAEGATDFQTNNQEEGVDEADFVKSDGTYVYAVYGDVVVIWNALTGDAITNYTLPPLEPVTFDGGGGGDSGINPVVFDSPAFFYQPKPQVQGLSLEAQRLVLYVQGYGEEVRRALNRTRVFSNAYDTRIVVLDTSTLPTSIDVVAQKDVHGSYRDARAVGNDIHVVTTSYVDYYIISQHLYRYTTPYEGMNSTEYIEAATATAGPLMDAFVIAWKNDVLEFGMPNVPQISIWQTDLGNNTNIVPDIYSNGAIDSFVQITSFNAATDVGGGELTISTAGAFTPSSWGYTYAVDGNLLFAAQGYNWSPDFGGSAQTTYILGFSLNGASATPAFLGSIPGYIQNQYNLNIYNGTMSVATTVQMWWPVWTDDNAFPTAAFTTNNTVYVYKLPTATEPLTEVGRVANLGKEGELFTSVRFFRNICYAVTFRQTDPFYVISTDPEDVRLLGELQISGFSSYIHSINDDDTLLVAIGQDADEEGRVLGVQISLFDATIPNSPTLLHRTVVESESDVWSSSTVQWDYKAFRYLPLGPDFGIVIVPLRVVAWSEENLNGNFDGFMAYDVSKENGITQRLNVTHVDSNQWYGCYYPAYLPERSLVFNGNLTTMKGHSVISTDLDTSETRWTLEMQKPIDDNNCVYWLF